MAEPYYRFENGALYVPLRSEADMVVDRAGERGTGNDPGRRGWAPDPGKGGSLGRSGGVAREDDAGVRRIR